MSYIKRFIGQHGIIFTGLLFFFLLDPFFLGYLFGYVLCIMVLLNITELKQLMDADFFLLLIYSLAFTAVYALHLSSGIQFLAIYLLFPPCFYLIGKKVVFKAANYKEVFYILFALSTLFSVSAVVSVTLNLIEGGFVQTDRTIPMFWNGKNMKATAMGAYLTYNMTIPGLLLNYKQRLGKIFMLVAATIFVLTLLSVFRLGSRTQLGISLIAIVVALFFIIPNQSARNNFKLIVTLGLIVGGFLIFFPIDLDADYFSVLGSRLQESENAGSAGGRTDRWVKSIEHIFTDPLGWEIEAFGFSHNMWFDVARYAGVIPFLLLVILTIRFYRKTFRAIRLKKDALLINAQILVYSIASFLIFFVEPIMEGLFFLFVSYCMFQGIINGYIQKHDVIKA